MRSSFRALQLVCGLVALGPIAVVGITACANPPPARAAAEPTPAEDSGTVVPTATQPAAAPTPTAGDPQGVALSTPPADDADQERPADLPPTKLANAVPPCARDAASFVDSHRSCKTDGDCAVESQCAPVGACAMGIRKDAVATFRAKHEAATKACAKAKVPAPCASCPRSPEPRCGAGFCRP